MLEYTQKSFKTKICLVWLLVFQHISVDTILLLFIESKSNLSLRSFEKKKKKKASPRFFFFFFFYKFNHIKLYEINWKHYNEHDDSVRESQRPGPNISLQDWEQNKLPIVNQIKSYKS